MIKKFDLEGVRTYDVNLMPDERGLFGEVLRQDWSDLVDDWISQVSFSHSYPGIVRAWHRHTRGQVDYIIVLKGALKICAYEDESKKLAEVVINSHKMQVVRIPGHYWHGTKCVGGGTAMTLYCMTRLYDYKNPDEERRPWNDPAIIPVEINGSKADPRANKAWDWLAPPYK